jgi:hypothetical protein
LEFGPASPTKVWPRLYHHGETLENAHLSWENQRPVVICRPFIRPHLVVGFWDINCYVGPSDLNQFRTSRIADFLSKKKKKIPLSRSLNHEWLFSCNRKLNDIAHVDAGIV